jgi:hypothetical protein
MIEVIEYLIREVPSYIDVFCHVGGYFAFNNIPILEVTNMKRILSWLIITCLVLAMTACKSTQNETSNKGPENPQTVNNETAVSPSVDDKTPATSSPDKIPSNGDKTALPSMDSQNEGVSTTTSISIDSKVWIGTWKWDSSDEYNKSTITVSNASDKAIVFSLNAFHVTNPKTMDGSNGVIEKKVALFEGDEAVFRDEELQFELRMKMKGKQLTVTTNNGNYFGAGVVVDGSYSQNSSESKASQNDNLIVPGKSIGKLFLGMTKSEVTKTLGKPTAIEDGVMTYSSSKNYIKLYFKDQILKQVEYTSPSFSTADGISINNFQERGKDFDIKGFQWRFLQVRYDSIRGGLSYFVMNADVPDDNEEYSKSVVGYLYEGYTMFEEPISEAKWEFLSP